MNDTLKNIIIRYFPDFILEGVKSVKKKLRKNYLKKRKDLDEIITSKQLVSDLKKIGLEKGCSVIVHSSMSKIGYLEKGPQTLIKALEEVIGKDGTLLMPSFPAPGRNKLYLDKNTVFDVKNTVSRMGAITEYFRLLPGVRRSLHPTDCVCARGPLADFYTNTHLGQLTPYNEFSPFRKLCDMKGKILMIGTTLDGSCTNLHTLEDALPFKYPVYHEKIFDVEVIDENGNHILTKTKAHDPAYSNKRFCDAMKPIFEKENILSNGKIAEADSMLVDAKGLLDVMIKYYLEYGVTMYTPYGDNGKLHAK